MIDDEKSEESAVEKLAREMTEALAADVQERVTINSDGSISMDLVHPVQSGKESLTKIMVPRPKAKDLREMQNGRNSIDSIIQLVSSATGHSPDLIAEIDAADFALLQEAVSDFLVKKFRATG